MNPIEYFRQIRAHRVRMDLLGACAATLWFPIDEDAAVMRKVARIHDLEKFPFFPALVLVKPLNGSPLARSVYDAMNGLGAAIQKIATIGTKPDVLARAQQAERIIDVVDRHLDPMVEAEFGRPRGQLADWLNQSELHMANELIGMLDNLELTEFLYGGDCI